jgi:hypothetical protein
MLVTLKCCLFMLIGNRKGCQNIVLMKCILFLEKSGFLDSL